MALTDDDKAWIADQGRILRGELGILREELSEKITDMETKILTAFEKWASPNEARQRSFRAELQAMELDLEALKDRVAKLEGKGPRN